MSGIAAIPRVVHSLVYGANSVVWRQADASMGPAANRKHAELLMREVAAFEVQP
jgi:hypothetical protein